MALTITFVLRDFAEWTSIPGPIQIIYALNSFIRFLWVVIWLALFGVFVYEFYLIIEKVLKLDSQIDVSFDFQPLRFPIVTVCNQNPYKLSEIVNANGNANFAEIAHFLRDYERVVAGGYRPIVNDRFAFNNASTRFAKEAWAEETLRLLANALPLEIRRRAMYHFDELVQSCEFDAIPCHRGNFTIHIDPSYGACYRFNMPNNSDFRTFRAGSRFGLRLILTVMQTNPAGEQLYLPTTKLAGVRISVDYENKNPFIDAFGQNCAVGREVNIGMKLLQTELMPEPYGRCVETVDEGVYNFYGNSAYTLQNCIRSCQQDRAINYCECADARHRKPDTVEFCTAKHAACLIGLRGQRDAYSFNALRDCACPPPCSEFAIATQMSTATFPPRTHFVSRSASPYASSGLNTGATVARVMPSITGWGGNNLYGPLAGRANVPTAPLTFDGGAGNGGANLRPFGANGGGWSSAYQPFGAKFPAIVTADSTNFANSKVVINPISSPHDMNGDDNLRTFHLEDYSCEDDGHTLTAHFGGDFERCSRWFAENSLALNLYYKGLDLEKHTQKSSYTISQASNDLGGQVSLWLGASVISVMEILTLLIMIVAFFIHGRKVRVIPTADEYNKDARYRHIQELKTELDEHERMDHELMARIERQRRSEQQRRIEFDRQLQDAHEMWARAAEDARVAEEALAREPSSTPACAAVANARTILRATERHLRQLHSERNLRF